MLIDLIVGSALLLFGLFLWFWLRSPALRERIERPKHVFLQQAQQQDRSTAQQPWIDSAPRSPRP
jgi:hypothetical protein